MLVNEQCEGNNDDRAKDVLSVIPEVQQFARHANLNTTMIYNHALDQAKNGCSDAITNAIF